MFEFYIRSAKDFMNNGNWKAAMFYLGKAEVYAGESNNPIGEDLKIIDDLTQKCYSETKPT